jgi:tetratricopeptide (TPR) repeat protein
MRRLLAAFALVLASPGPALAAPPPPSTSPALPAPSPDFEQTAADLEARARAAPRAPAAAEALAEAALLRLGLGAVARAEADAATLDHGFRGRRPDLVARVALARARRHAGLLAWAEVRAVLVAARPVLGPGAAVDDRLEAHALLGRALTELGRHREAELEYRRALALEKRAGVGARGTEAVGEAWFYFAEQARARAARVVLPPLAGPDTREAVLAYVTGPAARWMVHERYALEIAEVAYQRVLGFTVRPPPPPLPPPVAETGMIGLLDSGAGGDPNAPTAPWGRDDSLGPDPLAQLVSPRWSIAALARLAMAWAEFVKQLRELPVPRWPRHHGPIPGTDLTYEELREEYIHAHDPPDEELKQRARRACERALELSLTHRIDDEHTRACEQWLSRNYRREYHVLDDLRPTVAAPRAAGVFAPAPG